MNTSRMPQMPPSVATPFGLFAVIESKRVILPLKGVECDFSVVSGIGEFSITQIFRQENEKPLDCEYLFPLPADASVYFCEADINGRTIRAQVRERQEARQIAAEKKAAGFRTALVEAERENLFTLSLGNIQPGDLVIVQLKYFQTLRSLAGMPSIEIPFSPGIRYIPGKPLLRSNKGKGIVDDTDAVPDASRITPVRIDAGHPDAAYVEVRGTLDRDFVNEQQLASPSHSIDVQATENQLRISLSDTSEVPDRDFVLRWTEKQVETVASRAWIREMDNATYALLEVRAPQDPPTDRTPVDFYFLVDRSGSMAGEKWNKAAEALQSCMKVLGAADRAMVTFFESEFQDFAERPLSARELLQDRQFQAVKRLGTAGGTELRPALKHVLEVAATHSARHCKNLILITDAQIGNEPAILELMKAAPGLPVHCFGIDVALNDSLLLALCRQQGGTFHSLNPNDDIERAVTALGTALGQPVLLDLRVSAGWEIAEAAIPNLYAGQIHYLSARSSSNKPLELSARGASSQPVNIQFKTDRTTMDAPYLHWCRSRIQRLAAEGKESDAIELSVRSNLVCPLTAFIAWDESEKVPVATHELVQPDLMLFGASQFCLSELTDMSWAPERESLLAKPKTPGLFKKLFRRARGAQPSPQQAVAVDELKLKRELSDICHKSGITGWEPLVKAIFDWIAEASGAERTRRLQVLNPFVEEIRIQAMLLEDLRIEEMRGLARPEKMEQVRENIHELLNAFVENLPVTK